jgi:hypothetical protein
MHTCLTLTNVGGRWYVEREVAGLISALRGCCDSIHSCDISVEGPGSEGAARCWQVELRIRVFDEIVRSAARIPEGSDAQLSLSRTLADVYARASAQLNRISERHGGCCVHGGEGIAGRVQARA